MSEWKKTDITDMKPGIHERKWEIDSLCYPDPACPSILENHRRYCSI